MMQTTRAFSGALLAVVILGGATPLEGQKATAAKNLVQGPGDGPAHPMVDRLLDRLIGTWTVTRRMQGRTTTVAADVEWELNHQFVKLHYLPDSGSATPYEAMVFIGYDNAHRRYVVHWLDVGGGLWSETLGVGVPVPGGVRFDFAYPDGPFVNTFTFDPATGEWQSVMRQKNKGQAWSLFGDEHFHKR